MFDFVYVLVNLDATFGLHFSGFSTVLINFSRGLKTMAAAMLCDLLFSMLLAVRSGLLTT